MEVNMKSIKLNNLAILTIGLITGILVSQFLSSCADAGQDTPVKTGTASTGTVTSPHGTVPVYEYAYGWGMLETEGDAISLNVPELETMNSDWGEIEVYKTIEFPIAFEGGAQGSELYAINQIAEMGWELVCKYYVVEGFEQGHHYWFKRVKE